MQVDVSFSSAHSYFELRAALAPTQMATAWIFRYPKPADVTVKYEFDQSPYVTRAIAGLTLEGALGALLTGLMVLLFLRDWRGALIVVINIPLSLMGAV